MTMYLAWMLYGIMPVMAAAPVVALSAPAEMHMTHSMPMANDAAMAHQKSDCPHGDGMAHSPFCAACLVLPASIVIHDGRGFVFSYPAPGLMPVLRNRPPSPLAPPPRV